MVLSSYRTSQVYTSDQLVTLLCTALAQVVGQHAALCFGLHGETTSTPSYLPVETIDLNNKLFVFDGFTEGDMMQHLQAEHDAPWTSQETNPPWKLNVYHDSSKSSDTLHIAFIYHHALLDGLSGAIFHSSLRAALNEAKPSPRFANDMQIKVQQPLSLAPPIESLVNFNLSWGFLIGKVLEEYGPQRFFGKKNDHFAGLDCEISDLYPFQTQLRLLTINSDTVNSLLTKCKSKKVSMSVLLSVILARSLAVARDSSEAFIGSLPYTLKRVSGTDYQSMVNQTSALETEYSSNLLEELRGLDLDKRPFDAAVSLWALAEKESARLQSHLTNCRVNNLVGLLPYVSDHHEFYRKKLGKKRELTFELSNIGVIKPGATSSDSWRIEKAIFTQGAAVVGPALNVNVASVLEGPMSMTFSWQNKIVEESVVITTMETFESTLRQLTY